MMLPPLHCAAHGPSARSWQGTVPRLVVAANRNGGTEAKPAREAVGQNLSLEIVLIAVPWALTGRAADQQLNLRLLRYQI